MIEVTCEWFARCENLTTMATDHPILGPVPICARCAKIGGITPEFTVQEA